jgi:hypothetical protein
MKNWGIDMLLLLLYMSHAMQPLEVCLYKSFEATPKVYCDYWTYYFYGATDWKENLVQ